MKRVIIFFFAFFAIHLLIAQPQRLALLPSKMNIVKGGKPTPSSLCIDYFRDVPGRSGALDAYSHTSSGPGRSDGRLIYEADDYSTIKIRDAAGDVASHSSRDITYLSTQNDLGGLSERYKTFISRKIAEYNKPGFNSTDLQKLQSEIWSYDVLNHIGYIGESGDVLTAYRNGKTKFSRDFINGGQAASEADILLVGEYLKLIKKPFQDVPAKGFLLNKSSVTNDYTIFNGVGSPIYRGQDLPTALAAISSRCLDGELICIEMNGIENSLREKAITKYVKRRLETVHNKNVSIASLDHEFIWTSQSNRMSKEFSENNVLKVSEGGRYVYESKIEFETTIDKYTKEKSKIEARSPQRNLVVRFFSKCTETLKHLHTKYTLGLKLKQIRSQVLEGLQLSDSNYLDVFITTEDDYRTLVRLSKRGVQIIDCYATR